MQIETLLTGSKWEIIKSISKSPKSPLELSKELNTTIANISQQLRLLETAGLLQKENPSIKNRSPGKPRTLFSLEDDYAMITIMTESFSKKKLIKLSKKDKEALKDMIK